MHRRRDRMRRRPGPTHRRRDRLRLRPGPRRRITAAEAVDPYLMAVVEAEATVVAEAEPDAKLLTMPSSLRRALLYPGKFSPSTKIQNLRSYA